MELIGNIKNYQWGKKGSASAVAELAKCNNKDFVINESENYAELWMGAHVSGPSSLKTTNQNLQDYLTKQEKDIIGGHETLPFLFKVLSVRQALSIQVHPNKEEAARLHSERPDVYKDPNHKPEMAIALTPFTAMCGFRPYNEILSFCRKLPPLMELIGKNNVESLSQGLQGLKICFKDLMTADEESLKTCIKDIYENYTDVLKGADLYEIFQQINRDFPNDVGILCLFFLNILRLKPGEAIFLAANEIHAYLQGDCIECMACSDNVIRAGLTPKYKDVDTLLKNLNYEAAPACQKNFQPSVSETNYKLFSPSISDFAVAQITIPKDQSKYAVKNEKYGSILLVLEGDRCLKAGNLPPINVTKGSIIFIPGNCGDCIEFASNGSDKGNFVGYLAMYNSFLGNFN